MLTSSRDGIRGARGTPVLDSERRKDEPARGAAAAAMMRAPVAMAAALAAASPAYATIVYSGSRDIAVDANNTVLFDLDGDGNDDLALEHSLEFQELRYRAATGGAAGTLITFSVYKTTYSTTTTTTASFASNLVPGQLVSTGLSTVSFGYLNWSAQDSQKSFDPFGWVGANPGHLGLNFEISGATHFAWMQITRNAGDGSGIAVDWAYESVAGKGIPVPEPSADAMSMTVLAMGGAAVLARRRKLALERARATS